MLWLGGCSDPSQPIDASPGTIDASAGGNDSGTQPGGDAGALEPIRAEVRQAHLQHLQDYLDGDAAAVVAGFGPVVIDLGGGSSGDGSLPPAFYTEAYWEERFATPEFQQDFAGKQAGDLVLVDETRIMTKAEYEQETGETVDFGAFEYQDGDYLAFTPPVPDSALFDGWFGIYRQIDGAWKVVALD